MNICVFGDSITWGAWDIEKGGWVERLKNFYMQKEKADVFNFGVPGDTTMELLRRFKNEVNFRNPDLIIFAIGINDSTIVKIDNFHSNIITLIDIAKNYCNKIVFIGLTPVKEGFLSPYKNKKSDQYDKTIKEICNEQKIKYIEVKNIIEQSDLADGLHPNSQGHEKMYVKIRPEIEKLI